MDGAAKECGCNEGITVCWCMADGGRNSIHVDRIIFSHFAAEANTCSIFEYFFHRLSMLITVPILLLLWAGHFTNQKQPSLSSSPFRQFSLFAFIFIRLAHLCSTFSYLHLFVAPNAVQIFQLFVQMRWDRRRKRGNKKEIQTRDGAREQCAYNSIKIVCMAQTHPHPVIWIRVIVSVSSVIRAICKVMGISLDLVCCCRCHCRCRCRWKFLCFSHWKGLIHFPTVKEITDKASNIKNGSFQASSSSSSLPFF